MKGSRGPAEERALLVRALKEEGIVRSKAVEDALMDVPRELFVPAEMKDQAYRDHPLPIGHGQTISAPHMVAIMAEELAAEKGLKVLEIGCGSGYHAAVVSRLVGREGKVVSIERVPELVAFAKGNLRAAGIENVEVIEGDGSVGYRNGAPYDRIYYTCAAPDVPREVIEQVAGNGSILAVIGPKYSSQRLLRLTVRSGKVSTEHLTWCIFVPLLGEKGY